MHSEVVTSVQEAGPFVDRFEGEYSSGEAIGSRVNESVNRRGIDKEGVIGIDNGALRIQPLIRTGWGRAGLAYGPYRRANGLAFGVFLLNGHNTSQAEPLPDDLRMRWQRWLLGSETEKPSVRLQRWFK